MNLFARLSGPSSLVVRRSTAAPLLAMAIAAALLVPVCFSLARALEFRVGLVSVTPVTFYACVGVGGIGAAAALAFLVRTWRTRVLAPGAWTIAAGAFVCFVLGAAVHVVALGPYRELLAQTYVAPWGGAFALWLYAYPGLARFAGGRWSRIAGVALVELCAVAVLLEGALRIVAAVRPSQVFSLPQLGAREVLRAVRKPPGTLVWGMPTNSLGHFDEPFEVRGETPLVAAIGDSFSYGIVPHALHFTTVCETLVPPVQVANFGLPAIDPPEYLELLVEEALPLRPDLVVINVFIGNDLERGPDHAREVSLLRRFLDGERLYLSVVTPRLVELARQDRGMRGELEQMKAADGAPAECTTLEDLVQQNPWLVDHTLERATFSESAFLSIESSRALRTCRLGGISLERFVASFERILAAAGDTPVAVLLLPDEFQVEDPLWAEVTHAVSPVDLDRFLAQRQLAAWLESKGVPYEDVLPRLRALPVHGDGRRHAYKLRDSHFNVVGCRVAGEALAALVARVLQVPVRSDTAKPSGVQDR